MVKLIWEDINNWKYEKRDQFDHILSKRYKKLAQTFSH